MNVKQQGDVLSFEVVTDPAEITAARAQRERFDRNAAWLQANAACVYRENRGRCICISGEELFVADTPEGRLLRPPQNTPTTTAGSSGTSRVRK